MIFRNSFLIDYNIKIVNNKLSNRKLINLW